MIHHRSIAATLASLAPLLAAASLMPTAACAAEAQIAFDIPGGPLAPALARYAEQAHVQLIYDPPLAAGRQVAPLKGRLAVRDALDRLLVGTGIIVREVEPGILMLSRAAVTPHADGGIAATGAEVAARPDDIVVTGSHIRGASPAGSPTKVIGREEMQRNGYASVAQALQALPGNFGGMATEQSALSFSDRSGNNIALASGVNLRGLGPDATLVLVNGRRVAGAGLVGDFADISSIPFAAVDRIELVTDGASALYGSDAVAGVVNILLKPNFDGFRTDLRAGRVTKGHARDVQLAQTMGTGWAGGSLLIAYEYQRRAGLRSADRAYSRSADSRPFGGTDHRYPYSLPGNVLGFGPTGALAPAYAIPAGQDGTRLTPADFQPGVVNLENFRTGSDLSPDQNRHSLYGRAVQALGDDIDLSLEGRYAHRRFDSRTFGYATILSIDAQNPWFVSPTSAASDLIGYAFTRELGATRTRGTAESVAGTAALDAALGGDWKLSGYGAFASERDTNRTDRIANEYLLAEALGAIPDDPLTAYSAARDGYFNPYGDGTANSRTILDAISGYTFAATRSTILTADVVADGSLLTLPGGQVKLAIGADYRRERFRTRSVNYAFSATPEPGTPADYARGIWAGFAEIDLPLVGADNRRPGIERLDLSAAVRAERYGDFGRTTNPKIAVRWVPVEGLALRASWGTSFRAPNLRELSAPQAVSPAILRNAAGQSVVVLQRSGGNSGLAPERAKSWTVGLDLTPRSLSGLTASLTAFRTIFDRRIDLPALRGFSRALVDPNLAPFVRTVAPATNAADRVLVEDLLALAGGVGAYPVNSVAAIVDTRYVNTGRVDVAGADLDIRYAFDLGANRLAVGLSATYLERFDERVTPTAATVDQRNLAGKPVDLRGRLTANWSRGAFDALVGLNHVDPYRDALGQRIRAWRTVDLRIAYAPKQAGAPLSGVSIALVAQNLFDRSPPFYDSSVGAGYDGANADATGRYVALEISKRW